MREPTGWQDPCLRQGARRLRRSIDRRRRCRTEEEEASSENAFAFASCCVQLQRCWLFRAGRLPPKGTRTNRHFVSVPPKSALQKSERRVRSMLGCDDVAMTRPQNRHSQPRAADVVLGDEFEKWRIDRPADRSSQRLLLLLSCLGPVLLHARLALATELRTHHLHLVAIDRSSSS